jgi:hypothetical protein
MIRQGNQVRVRGPRERDEYITLQIAPGSWVDFVTMLDADIHESPR